MDFEQIHKNRINKLAAKRTGSVEIDGGWSIRYDKDFSDIFWAFEDFKDYFNTSFGIILAENSEKCFLCKLDEALCNGFAVTVEDKTIILTGGTKAAVVQAIFYCEDVMNGFGAAVMEKKTYSLTPRFFPRLASSGLENRAFTDNYLKIMLHYGINGIVIYDDNYTEICEKAKKYGLLTYLVTDKIIEDSLLDGLILSCAPTDGLVECASKAHIKCVFDTEYGNKRYELPDNCAALVSFEAGESITRDGVTKAIRHTSLAAAEPNENAFNNIGGEKWVKIASLGATADFPTVPYIPAFMQFMLRNEALFSLPVTATVETDERGFLPSIVGEFQKAQSYKEAEEPGIALQRLIVSHYGAENTDKLMMTFKKLSDGVNYFLFDKADMQGALWFGPAFPLVAETVYDYDFASNDITLECDLNLKAAECFSRAAKILKPIESIDAEELYNICAFIANTLVTSANCKRWYRRIYALKSETADFKRKFIIEQMQKIAREEIENATDTAELIFAMPKLSSTNSERLCTLNALEAKIKLTENAINNIVKEIK